jgi:hypothetical protein
MSEGIAASRTIAIQAGKALVLFALFVLLTFGLPMGLRALGAGHWLKSQGFGAAAFLYLFILCGLVLVVAITMALRRRGLPGALSELGVLPLGLRGILLALLSAATMVAVVLVLGGASNATATAAIIARNTIGPLAEELFFAVSSSFSSGAGPAFPSGSRPCFPRLPSRMAICTKATRCSPSWKRPP